MRDNLIRHLTSVGLVPIVVLGLAACGSQDTAASDPGSGTTSDTASLPASDDAIRPAAGDEVPVSDFANALQAGITDVTTAHIVVTQDMLDRVVTMEASVDFATNPPDVGGEMTTDGDTIEIRIVENSMFMNMGELTEGKFIEMPIDGAFAEVDGLFNSLDFGIGVDQFGAAAKKVVYVGEEDVNGADAAQYDVTVDPSKIDLGFGGALTDVKTAIYKLWLDDDQRVVRLEMALDDLGSIEMDITAWGEPVDIEAPAANEITDLSAS